MRGIISSVMAALLSVPSLLVAAPVGDEPQLGQTSGDPCALLKRAVALYQAQQFHAAADTYSQVLDLMARNPRVAYRLTTAACPRPRVSSVPPAPAATDQSAPVPDLGGGLGRPATTSLEAKEPAKHGASWQRPALASLPSGDKRWGAISQSQREMATRIGVPALGVNPADNALFVLIPPGRYLSGCVPSDPACEDDEKPRREVTISRGFQMMAEEVTIGQFSKFAQAQGGSVPPQPIKTGEDLPIVNVTWHHAQRYCEWSGGRLPSESEWEYAARGGSVGTIFPWGNEFSQDKVNSTGSGGHDWWEVRSPVGAFPPNGFGLFDISGNVWEWCADWYKHDYYADSPTKDPRGPAWGNLRTVRGGSWLSVRRFLRLSFRNGEQPTIGQSTIGFRCVRDF